MRSVSFLRLGSGRRAGERGACFPSASKSWSRPTLPLKFSLFRDTCRQVGPPPPLLLEASFWTIPEQNVGGTQDRESSSRGQTPRFIDVAPA